MGCFLVLFALISPRLGLIYLWLTGDLLSRSMDSWVLPLIGFFVLPWTTLAWAVMWDAGTNRVTGFEWFLVGLAFVLDLASLGGGSRARSERA